MLHQHTARMSNSAARDAGILEHYLRAIFDSAFQFCGLLSTEGTLLEVNQTALDYIGASRSDVLGLPLWETPWWTALEPEARTRLSTAIENAARGAFVRYEIELPSRTGEVRSFDVSLKPVTDETGRVLYIVWEGRDITDRRRAEDALRVAEARAAGVISIAADAIVSVDDAQRITLFNKGAERIFGYAAEEVVGQSLDLLIPERFRPTHVRHIAQFAESTVTARRMGERREIFGRRKDGTDFPAEASISKLDVGGKRVFTAVLRDVSDRKQAELEKTRLLARETAARAAAEAAERRSAFLAEVNAALDATLDYELGLRNLAQIVVPALASYCIVDVLDEDGGIRRLNIEAADSEKSSLVDGLREFLPDPQHAFLTRGALATGRPELVAEVTDGILRQVTRNEANFAALRALEPRSYMVVPLVARGVTLGALALIADQTRRAFGPADLGLAEELARRAALSLDNARLYQLAQRATRLRDDVLGVVSHDLRNPVAAIAMCARALEDIPGSFDEPVRGLVRTIHESVELMQRMIQDLLDATSIEAGRLSIERKVEDAVLLIVQAVEQFDALAAEQQIRLVADIPDATPPIFVDGDRLLQVLGNLLANAIKFTPSGGRVTLRAVPTPTDLVLSVIDSGAGIPAADLPHIFDRFWHSRRSARARGTGLGLAIVKGIVEAHGGRIWVESTLGVGTAVHFTLPIHREGHGMSSVGMPASDLPRATEGTAP